VHPAGSPRSWLRKKVVERGTSARFGREGSSAGKEPGIGTRLVEVCPAAHRLLATGLVGLAVS